MGGYMRASRAICSRHIGNKRILAGTVFAKRFFISCVCAGLFCFCANASENAWPASPASDDNKTELRNNAASLLVDLLDQEKDVSKILIIKRPSVEIGRLIKSISKTAGDGSDQLEALTKNDKTLN